MEGELGRTGGRVGMGVVVGSASCSKKRRKDKQERQQSINVVIVATSLTAANALALNREQQLLPLAIWLRPLGSN